jgi:hypothetical protein
MPAMFQNDLPHTPHSDDLQQVETRDISGLGGNENIDDAITRNAIMAQTAQQFAKANSSPGTVRVITIRTVRRDRRLWNAAILAAACAVLALAVISFPQHFPSKLSGIFVHPQQPATAVDPMPDAKVETEMTTKLPSLAPASTLSKPVTSLATSKSTVQNASQKQVLLKPRTRSAAGEFVAKDTFVDYRNRPAEQAATTQKTIKRVVVQN